MCAGRRKNRVAAAGIPLVCALLAASVGPAAAAKHKPKLVFLKARVVSDHTVTPGQLETIAVSHLPARAPLKVFIEPPPVTPECGELYFCDPAPTSPAPGTPPYKASGKGRALLTFVMPSTYFVETDFFHPNRGYVQHFANGQAVHVDVEGIRRTKKAKRVGFGFSRAVVQLSPAS
jgi:hypothetical protein